MYNFDDISASYEFCTCITFPDGQKNSFSKVEHIEAKVVKTGFLFTFEGSGDESFDGTEPDDWSSIFLSFGKALYPYTLQVSENGKLIGIKDFEKLKARWTATQEEILDKYDYNYEIKKIAYSYAYTLKSEKMFLSMLRRNMFFHLFFWQDNLPNQEIEIKDFPINSLISIFCIQNKKIDNDVLCYETDTVYDEGTFDLLSGECKVNIRRDLDGLPSEITVFAKVEKRYRGYYTKEITLRRL